MDEMKITFEIKTNEEIKNVLATDEHALYDAYLNIHEFSYEGVTYKHERRLLKLKDLYKCIPGLFKISEDELILSLLKNSILPDIIITFIANYLETGYYENVCYTKNNLDIFSSSDFEKLIRFILSCPNFEHKTNCYDDVSTYYEYSISEFSEEREEVLELLELDCLNNNEITYVDRKAFFYETYVFLSCLLDLGFYLDIGREKMKKNKGI